MTAPTMRAIRHHTYGSADVLELQEVPRPEPGEGGVLVRVHAAGVNPVDWKLRTGKYHDEYPLDLPHVPGFDFSGVVEAVGPGVTNFRQGDAVYGVGSGAYAEFAPAEAVNLALMPRRHSFEHAAAVPIGGLTAWTGLFTLADLQSGQR